MKVEVERAAQQIADSEDIVVISHERPDGDAVGSLLGLSLALQKLGKQVTPVMAEPLPEKWLFLPGAHQIQQTRPTGDHMVVAVDSADKRRLGFQDPGDVDLNIDHHPSNTRFGKVNLVEPDAAATTEVLYRHFPQLGLSIGTDVAENLLVGLITDTLGFRTSSVSPRSLRIAAELMELGADMASLYKQAMYSRSYEAVRYWAGGLAQLDMRDGIVWAVLSLASREAAKYPSSDDADLIDVLTTIDGPKVAIMFVEQHGKQVKISWRSQPGLDVSELAASFDGGGHELAAGAVIKGEVPEVVERVLAATVEALDSSNH